METSEFVDNHAHYTVAIANNISRNISSSRKMLKFLKFINPCQKAWIFYNEKGHKPLFIKMLVQIKNFSAFFLYLADNMVWLGKLGLISGTQDDTSAWYKLKDTFALIKNLCGLLMTIFSLIRRYRSIKKILAELDSFET